MSDEAWDELLDGKPVFNQWQEQTFLLRLLSTSTLDEEERLSVTEDILDQDLDYDYAREIAEYLLINQQHFSNIPNPSQTQIARFLKNICNL
jgi:hypothetical protein